MKKRAVYKEKIKNSIENIMWVYEYAHTNFFLMIIYSILGLSGVLLSLLSSFASRDLVDIITQHKTGELIKSFVMLLTYQVVTVLINSISNYTRTYISSKFEKRMKSDIFEKIVTTKWEDLCNFQSGDLSNRLNGDITFVTNGLLNTIPNFIVQSFRLISAVYVICIQDYTFAIISIISMPISILVSRLSTQKMRKTSMESMKATSSLSQIVQESISNSQSIKALDMVKPYIGKMNMCQEQIHIFKMKNQKASFFNAILMSVTTFAISYAAYGWGIYKVWSGAISYGTMTMFLSLSNSLSSSISSFIGMIPSTISFANSAYRIKEITELPKDDYSQYDEIAEFKRNVENVGVSVCLNDVSFSYRNGTEVFKNVNFFASPREIVALVGPSGEGKTTLLRLILSIIYCKDNSGYVIAGYNTSGEMDKEKYQISAATRQLFSYVPQGNTMFTGTIAENMRNVKEDASDEEIVEALKMACAWEFVQKLPQGINSEIKERGIGFSEGQAQRLSIARALIRKSPILLLDEATSALDIKTEKRVLDNIISDSHPRTCIVTTHRPAVMDICDRVYTVENRIVFESKS